MVIGVSFCRFRMMVICVRMMRVGEMSMMPSLLVIPGFVMLRRCVMMLGGFFMMVRRRRMMLSGFLDM